jgi:hypothetical protein
MGCPGSSGGEAGERAKDDDGERDPPHGEEDEHEERRADHGTARRPRRVRTLDGALEEREVARVRLPRDVEGVAEQGDAADDAVERDVGDHAEDDHARRAESGREEDEIAGEGRACDVAEPGDESEDGVEAEADLRARQTRRAVEQTRQ